MGMAEFLQKGEIAKLQEEINALLRNNDRVQFVQIIKFLSAGKSIQNLCTFKVQFLVR